jgi:hypothetical protein
LIMSDFESLFLQAEAAQRGWITSGTAQSFYESAITQSFVYLEPSTGTPVADAAAYFGQALPNVGWASSSNKLTAILTQKWAALNGINWFEAYTDFRRTGVPALPISASTIHVVPQIPVRFLFPQVELNTNGSNVPSLPVNAQFTDKIFWNQ